jgi:predicted small secreted protein
MKLNSTYPAGLKVAVLSALFAGVLTFSGCRTMEGAGEDLETAAEEIQDAAR